MPAPQVIANGLWTPTVASEQQGLTKSRTGCVVYHTYPQARSKCLTGAS